MKRFLLSCSVLAVIAATPVQAAEIPADSRLTAATVYSGRATLTRHAVIQVPAGSHTLVFKNLSSELLPDSLRAEGSAVGKVTFGALSHKLVAGADLVAPREKELSDMLTVFGDQRKSIEAEKQALLDKKAFLTTLGQQGALRTQENIAEINLKPDQWTGAAKALYSETADTLKSLIAQDSMLRELDKQINKVQGELNQLRTGQRNTYEVTLPLESSAPTELGIDLSYQIPGASWSPLYDARLDTNSGKLELIQYGAVRQNSGEDWTDVALTLSTAQPQRGTGLPDLTPFWLSLFERQQYGGARQFNDISSNIVGSASKSAAPMAPAMEMAMDSAVMAPEPIREKAEFVAATIETGGFVSEYKIPGPSVVKADGTESKLMIGSFDSDSKMQIQIKPQISTDAYLVANTTLKGESPILPGAVNLFRDGAFVGQSSLPLLRPGEDQDLAFGIDDQVSVKRKVLKDQRSEAGVISKDTVLERHMVTEIQNLHTTAVAVSVLETVPASQNKEIRTEVLADKTTPGYKEDLKNVKGLLNWTVQMEPKQKSEVKLGWKVSWPQDKTLSGL